MSAVEDSYANKGSCSTCDNDTEKEPRDRDEYKPEKEDGNPQAAFSAVIVCGRRSNNYFEPDNSIFFYWLKPPTAA